MENMENTNTYHGSNDDKYRDFEFVQHAGFLGFAVRGLTPEVVEIKKDGPYKGEKRCIIRARLANTVNGEIFEQTFWPHDRCTEAEMKEWPSRQIADMEIRFGYWLRENEDGTKEWVIGEPKWLSTRVAGRAFEKPKGEAIKFKKGV